MEKQFEELKSEICKKVCEYLRHRNVEEGIIAVTGVKIMAHGNSSRVELPVILQLVEMLDETIKTQTEHLATAYVKNNESLYNKLSYRLEAFEQIKLWVNNKLSK